MWQEILRIDIKPDLNENCEIDLVLCHDCDLQYFLPVISGGPGLYRELQRNESYYISDKWEYRQALSEINRGQSVCEIGCGTGAFIEQVNRLRHGCAVGLELNSAAAKVAVSRGIPVQCAGLVEYARDHQNAFDVVCAFQVLEHVADPLDFMKSAIQLLKKNGKLILSVPNRESFLKWQNNILDMPPHHVTRWSRRAILHLFGACGLHNIRFVCEPLAAYHVDEYVKTLVARSRGGILNPLCTHWRVQRLLVDFLRYQSLRRWVRGHTLYVSASLR